MIALKRALEGAAGAVASAAGLALLGSAGGAVSRAVASAEALQLVVVNLLASPVAQAPEEHTSDSEDNGATNTNAHTDDDALVLSLCRFIALPTASGQRDRGLGGNSSD